MSGGTASPFNFNPNLGKKNVVIRAPLLSISGYGVHSRQVFKWAQKRNFNLYSQIVPWGNTTWMVNPDMEGGLVGEIMSTSSEKRDKYDISFQVQLPDEWDPNLAEFNIGVSAVVETDRCNPEWIDRCNLMNCVVVPSNHIRDVLLRTGEIKVPLYVIPEWYFEEIDTGSSESIDVDLCTDFNFLLVGQFTGGDPWNDRKNIYFTIKWFCEVFKDDPNVGLILKANHGRGTRIDREITRNKVRQILGEVRKSEFPKVHLIHGNLTPGEIISLYKNSNVRCLLSLTRGEGFGLPLLEASACELPVIATNWSAHLDFLNLGKFIPVQYKLEEIPSSRVDNRIFLSGMKWAQPLEDDFKKKILKFRNKYTIPDQWASELSKKVRNEFCDRSIMLKYDKLLSEMLGI